MKKYISLYNTCSGPSMYPIIKNGDAFKLKKDLKFNEYKAGDIIVYPHPEKPIEIVHRIIQIKPEGVITRGDNNNLTDPYIIEFKSIRGIVIFIKRGNREIKVSNGYRGLIIHKLMPIRKNMRVYVSLAVKIFSIIFIKSKLLFFIHNFLELSIISIKRNGIEQENLMLKEKRIGRKTGNEPWKIKFPYKLLINTDKLK